MVMSSAVIATSAATDDTEEVGAYSNQNFLETQANNAYNEANLGATYSAASTTFKTWSPNATAVKVKLYKTGSDNESGAGVIGEYAMTKNSTTGVWSYTLSGDHKNQYYTYLVTVNGATNETQDVYSKATGVNGKRSMIVDLDSTDPDGWSSDNHVLLNNAQEAVVWEVHVRDFSISENSGVSEDNMGRYLAFTEGGTKLNGDANSVSTCVDYLVEQGINCVQLQPVYDFESVDEDAGASSSNRNWGYDPQNYNVPEGSYSSNPYDGNVRIKEFKQMIQALHDRGISVVMDVVYNHTYSTASCFNKTVPGYYYRMKSNTQYSNGSGCGNETASDKKMFRKYMIESCRYWVDEYHIDGFRFDLMGLHDVTTMNAIRTELNKVSSKILMYGEPWAAEWNSDYTECGLCPNSSISSRITSLNKGIGMFNDKYRDAIKGDTDGTGKGFVQGNTSTNAATVVSGVKGKNYNAQAPAQTIAYADAHDNLILWDKILRSNGSSSYTSTSASTTEKYRAQVREVMALLMTSQGIPFMTAGSEFARTKKGNKNSYNASDAINQIDWSRVSTFSDLAEYYKGLLQIRKNYAPLKGANFSTPTFPSSSGNVVAYTYSNSTSGQWGKMCVLVNGGTASYTISNLGASSWVVVANTTKAGLTSLGTVNASSYSIPAKSAAILVEASTFNNLKYTEQFGTLTINHVDDSGKVLKTSTAKYRAGNTYHAVPDTTLLFDYNLIGTEGNTSGTISANTNTTVTYKYSNAGIVSGYLNVSYVDQSGTALKDPSKKKLRGGDTYDVAIPTLQGYQLDTSQFPANIKGTFTGDDINIKFVFKKFDSSTIKVHYYNSNNWSDVRLYAYCDDGTAPNGEWAAAPKMTSEGSGWFVGTVNAPAAKVMFHPTSTTSAVTQEPGQGEPGYDSAGEVWIQNKTVQFSSTMIVSHIDLKTGQKLASDQVTNMAKTTSSTAYTTSPISGRTDAIAPINASGNYQPGIFNVVYLYGEGGEPYTDPQPDTKPTDVQPDTKPTTPDPDKKILIGDVNFDGFITVADATMVQKAAAEIITFSSYETIAGDCNGDGLVSVADATLIQKYAAEFDEDLKLTGTYVGKDDPTPTTPDPEPYTEPDPDPNPPATILLTDNFGWGTAYVYAWDADGNELFGAWPGSAQAETQTNDYGETQFICHVPEGAAGVIFNNGAGAQTEDITDFYSYTGYWMDGTQNDLGHYLVTGW